MKKYFTPEKCQHCGTEFKIEQGENYWQCPNPRCGKIQKVENNV